MKMRWVRMSLILSGLAFVGCEPNASTPLTPVVPAAKGSASGSAAVADASKEWMDHPEYVHWSKFPIGTSVTRVRKVSNEFGTVTVTTRMRLARISSEEVGVGIQVDVERPGEAKEVNPEMVLPSAAKFQIPKGMNREAFLLPSPKAKRGENVELEIGGKSYACEVYEWEEVNEAGPMEVRLWRSDEMPGRIVRQEMLTKSSGTKTIEEIAEVTIPSEPNRETDAPTASDKPSEAEG